jgi:hypothetical protein
MLESKIGIKKSLQLSDIQVQLLQLFPDTKY